MVTTNYLWDGESYLGETDENHAFKALFTNLPDRYTNLVSQRRASATSYAHFDALGSTRQLTDQSGSVTDELLYDAWGKEVSRTGSTNLPFQFVGRYGYYRDDETDAFYILARTYQPSIARWWSQDPAIILLDFTLFRYCRNRPLFSIDPGGQQDNSVDIVSKSYIRGEKSPGGGGPLLIGFIDPLPSGGPVWYILLLHDPFGTPGVFSTTQERLDYLGNFVKGLDAFNQNPETTAKDEKYRLFSRKVIKWRCCGGKFKYLGGTSESHGGIESLGPLFPDIWVQGPMDVTEYPDKYSYRDGKICLTKHWMGYGKPNPLVEPGMQWVAKRTSLYIWHDIKATVCCEKKTDKGSSVIDSFRTSRFPSHKLWKDNTLQLQAPQGQYADLWVPSPNNASFVKE